MLSNLSCACWAFVCLLWESIYSSHLYIFKLDYLFALLNCRNSFYILDAKLLPDHGLQIFSPICRLLFHSVLCFLYCTENFKFNVVPFVLFLFPMFLVSYPRNS